MTASSAAASIRSSLRPKYPEIDRLYSDKYLEDVAAVPGRAFEYARDEKIGKALEWRRSYRVDELLSAFEKDGKTFSLSPLKEYEPSAELVEVCKTGALYVGGIDENSGRVILHAKTALIDWWICGVEAGLQYHVMVIEQAIELISHRNKNGKTTPESMILLVDTTNSSYVPPPATALTGLVNLLQRAYPDRIHCIHVGPVNAALRKIYDLVSPLLRPRSRDKIVLLGNAPSAESVSTAS